MLGLFAQIYFCVSREVDIVAVNVKAATVNLVRVPLAIQNWAKEEIDIQIDDDTFIAPYIRTGQGEEDVNTVRRAVDVGENT